MIRKRLGGFPLILFGFALLFQGLLTGFGVQASGDRPFGPPKNIILIIGDGMGLSTVTAARLFKHGQGDGPLSFEKFPVIGYQATGSADGTVTDSAAAASAWACGEKFLNGAISCHDTDRDGQCDVCPQTILELAKAKGKSAGLVVTSTITHATPAAFAAHVADRDCELEIARQYIESSGVDMLLGGGFGPDSGGCSDPSSINKAELIEAARKQNGFLVISDRKGLLDAAGITGKRILGLFSDNAKTPEYHRLDPSVPYPPDEPTLAEMAGIALDVLGRDPDGFFMVMEGSQIDWAHHRHDIRYLLAETLGFDTAVATVVEWLESRPEIGKQTLILVMADHETGGFSIVASGSVSGSGKLPIKGKWTTGAHTGGDTLIWS